MKHEDHDQDMLQFVATSAALAELAREPTVAVYLGAALAAQVQSVTAAIRQRFASPASGDSC